MKCFRWSYNSDNLCSEDRTRQKHNVLTLDQAYGEQKKESMDNMYNQIPSSDHTWASYYKVTEREFWIVKLESAFG